MRVLTARDDAVLIECNSLDETIALFDALTALRIPGVGEMVPGARTLLVPFRPARVTAEEIEAAAAAADLSGVRTGQPRRLEIPTRYDGEDLAEVAELLGLSTDEVVRRHTSSTFTVGFVGFAPGFAYLTGDDPVLDVPRRATPRTRIPAGSVALAGTYSGVYPRESPGGWQLIGTTEVPMWDLDRDPAAFMAPGDLVTFSVATTRARASVSEDRAHSARGATPAGAVDTSDSPSALEVLSPGLQTLFQDLGRDGYASMGVSASGALDAPAHRQANRLVGSAAEAPTLEVAYGGLLVRAHGPQVVAVTGAEVPLTVSGTLPRTAPFGAAFALDDGDELQLGSPAAGVRSYLAVRGGFGAPPVLESLATDLLAGLGPDALKAGDLLSVLAPHATLLAASPVADAPPRELPRAGGETVELRIVLGPRDDWFSAEEIERFTGQDWQVTPQSNRVGVRLDGDALTRVKSGELPSEGCVSGAIQMPPNGQPVLFLADHPLTGGYPVLGAVITDDLPLAGQLPVGATVRFRIVEPRGHQPRTQTPRTQTPGELR
ncbi:5-oxoprolinase/urea amidolyase family protein [Pseudoclavibacter sp. VKM Ac-2867]|uniref:5-oxoprolinase subunit B/C family protein n=1 Tax=Pseudoclavibacter sp. VKM Ac-2867 TaxID=2783829 RepID=UPI00188B72F9|nr:5-oxoprolinase/urea amidolyase family protein [Pseudoclavibacter sp. VKM Ac-2867]MBF4458561.1 5-oxoprolinase/urea amidolyase family protein [Pseudoclavibacter sp. VKM Ac-2867]